MTNKIGEKIKALRKKANVTQEKFADYLGITFQAVSRWESGICYPDLEIIPAIANYFNVTTDELLGVDVMNKEARVKEIEEKLSENSAKGLIDENIAICRNAVNEFPNDYRLLSSLAFYLGKRDSTLKEAISINERILSDCTNDNIRYGVMQKLAYDYNSIGEKDKAIEVAKKLPRTPITCDMLLRHIYDGEDQIMQLRSNISSFCDYITQDIKTIARTKYSDESNINDVKKRIELYKKAIDIYKIMYEECDYGFYNCRITSLYLASASHYMLLDDFENALDCLEEAADYTISFDTLPEDFMHTSMIFEDTGFSKSKQFSKNYDYNNSYEMLNNILTDARYDKIRETERFRAIAAKLAQYAVKE